MGLGEVVPPGSKAKERSWFMRCRGQWVLNALFLEPNVKNWVERKEIGRDLDVLPGAHGLKGLVTRLWGCWERWNFTKVGTRENGYGGGGMLLRRLPEKQPPLLWLFAFWLLPGKHLCLLWVSPWWTSLPRAPKQWAQPASDWYFRNCRIEETFPSYKLVVSNILPQ